MDGEAGSASYGYLANSGLLESVAMIEDGAENELAAFLATRRGQRFCKDVAIARQTDKDLCGFIPKVQRIRYAGPDRVPMEVFEEAARTGFYISRAPVSMEGRIELLQYIQEQSVSINYHRYGNLGDRAVD